MTPQLCLGTAQFGLAYGITNLEGQVSEAEVGRLLGNADVAGISWLDTAQAYGNAESVLGRQLPKSHGFRLISKLPLQTQPVFTRQDSEVWEENLFKSCQRLGVESLDALLLHSTADLRKPGSEHLEGWILDLRDRGLVQRVGVSIYEAEDLEGVNLGLLDIVQLPLSLYDQRLLQNGTLKSLHDSGIAIHARSLYLQGLLLTPAANWPRWVSANFLAHQQSLQKLADEKGCTLIDLALGFAKHQKDLEAVVIGVCSVQELEDLCLAWMKHSLWHDGEWRAWALHAPDLLDPRTWPVS